MKLLRLPVLIFLSTSAALIFISWSYAFYMRPTGRLRRPVVFQFYDKSNKPAQITITSFTVSERTEGRWRPVWSVHGRERLKEITYGARYMGLTESVAAHKLSAMKTYAGFADDGSGGSAGRYFRFTQDGTIVLPESPD